MRAVPFCIGVTVDSIREKLADSVVGIAGLGGLGSNVAAALVRTNVGRLVIVDFDNVEAGNLNRQQYFLDQVGVSKTAASIENLRRINPDVEIVSYNQRLTAENIPQIFAGTDVIAECFDRPDQKRMLVETVLGKMNDTVVVSVSGLAGYGGSNAITTKRICRRLILVGDDESDADVMNILTAGRVGIAACHQANAIVEVLLDEIKA